MSVDNRYTGVGYEPPIHTEPLDTGRYVLIEDYQELEAERDRYKSGVRCPHCDELRLEVGETANLYREQRDDNIELRARHAALVEAAMLIEDHHHHMCNGWTRGGGDIWMEETVCNCGIKELKAALAEEVETCQKQR